MIRAGFWEKVRAPGLAGIVKAAYGIVKAAYRRAFDNPNSYLKRVIIRPRNPFATAVVFMRLLPANSCKGSSRMTAAAFLPQLEDKRIAECHIWMVRDRLELGG
jgi:hypothetical protein